MKTVHKYELSVADEQFIEMPINAEILTVQIQYNEPKIWALVDPELKTEFVKFTIFGTGHTIEDGFSGKYVGTYQLYDGKIVFHLFKG